MSSRHLFGFSFPSFVLLGLSLLVIIPLAILILTTGFDGLYGQDPYAYYKYAVGPLRANLLGIRSWPPFFWPPGYPVLVALLSFITGVRPLAGQLVSLLAGALVPPLTALLAREVWPQATPKWLVPAVAGLLVALMPQLWQSSSVVMADTTALAAVTLGVWALARYGGHIDRGSDSQFVWLAIAAASISFAVLTRWAYALVAIPCTLYALWSLARQDRLKAISHAVGAGVLTMVVLWPLLPSLSGTIFSSQNTTSAFVGNFDVYSWHPAAAFRRVHTSPDGILSYRLPNGLYYALAPAHRFYFTPLLAALLVPGFWKALRPPNLRRGLLLFGWIAVIYFFHIGAPWQNFRFTLAYLPPVAILAAIGFAAVVEHISPAHRWLPGLLFATGLLVMGLGGWSLTEGFIGRKNAHLQTMHWAQGQMLPEAQLITFGITLTFEHYSPVETYDISLLDASDLAGLLDAGRPTYLLLDLESVASQWVEETPYLNYRWLHDVPGLVTIGDHGGYRLMRVETPP